MRLTTLRPRSSKTKLNNGHVKFKASAPGKVILFGEHFVVHGTGAILCAIDKRVHVTVERTYNDRICIKSKVGCIDVEQNRHISEIRPELRPFYYLADKRGGIKIDIDSEIPIGAGLGSSSACCVALAAAILALDGNTDKRDILNLAVEAEKTIFENTSGADCAVCTYGGIGRYDLATGFVRMNKDVDIDMIIADSGISHTTDEVVKRVRVFAEQNVKDFADMCAQESIILDEVMTMLVTNDIHGLGKMFVKNQRLLEKIGVSNETLDEMISIGQGNNTMGIKITGAGDGGCVIAITDRTNKQHDNLVKLFKSRGYGCFAVKIDHKGISYC